MYINVLVQINIFDDKLFTYSVPASLFEKVSIGSRVSIPFGKKAIEGLVIAVNNKVDLDFEVKDIIDVLDGEPLLNEEMMFLGKFISETYLCSLIDAYKAMLPPALKFSKSATKIKKEVYIFLKEEKEVTLKSELNIIEKLKNNDRIKKNEISNKVALKHLISLNIVGEIEEEVYRLNSTYDIKEIKALTDNQKRVVSEIEECTTSVCLLRGITGSGKTEIYMELIDATIKLGKQAIVLVPEISITTQLISRFRNRFGSDVAVLHSSLSESERYDEWRKIKRGEVNIAIGARSAIFAPFSNLGIIIVDEEHESTYKQENNPRYNTIDVATERCRYNNAKLILGSATPSLESYARAKTNKYQLVELLERINKKELPKVTVIDMLDEMKKGNKLLSDIATAKIIDRINKKEQIMILINRRGYSNYIMCNECGDVLKCPNCDISLTYHKSSNTMRCHYCGYAENLFNKCKKCNSPHIILKGTGTEKVEEILNATFKGVRIIRMDADTTSKKGTHESIINDFNDYKYDVLLGTQMIAKGLDFDNVTLVVVINGDYSLNIPDYRSSEKTFQLLTQVAGRAGRKNLEGEIIIQTFNPNHYAISLAQTHDYLSFYNKEMIIRKKLYYPPFCFIVAVRIITSDFDEGNKTIEKVNSYLRTNLDSRYIILGPSVSLKINNTYKFQCIIKYKEKESLYEILKYIQKHYKNSKTKLEIDFNPLKM